MEDTMSEEKKDEGWTAVETVANETEAALLAGFLESEGIPARVVDRSFHLTPTPEDSDLSPIAVAVPNDRLPEALQVLGARETESSGPEADEIGSDDPKRVR